MLAIKKVFLFASFSFLFFILSLTIPITGIFFLPLSSISLTILFVKSGILWGLVGIIIPTVIIYNSFYLGDILSFVFILFVALNSLLLYSGIKRKGNCWQIVVDSCITISLISITVVLLFIINGFQVSWIDPKIVVNLPKDIPAAFVEIITRNIYSIIVIFVIVIVVLSYIFLSLVADKFNLNLKKLPSFEKWRLPEVVIFAFIFSLLFYIVFKHTGLVTVGQVKNAVLFQIVENIFNLIFFLYFIGGLALCKFFFSRSKAMLILSYIAFILYSPLAVFLSVLDIWFDFRKKKKNAAELSPENTEKSG
ncbi:MAG: DUF2232 domain-containing protein [Elusimicrobiota bacterium]